MSNQPRRVLAVLIIAVLACVSSMPRYRAAVPSSGTVSPSNGTLTYMGGPFAFSNMTGDQGTPVTCLDPIKPCDDFALTTASVPTPDVGVYILSVGIAFTNLASDFDLYLYDADGTVVASSTGGAGAQEQFSILASPGTTHYTVRVIPYSVTTGSGGDTYTATVTLGQRVTPSDPPELPTVPGVPRFKNYQSPSGMGDDSGEPSIGADWSTDKAMFQAGLQTFRVGFDDCASPGDATWVDVSFPTTSEASLDPILFTDSRTNRTFVSQLTGACSSSAFTDDDGVNYTPSQGCGTPAGADHQTIGGGPFAPGPTDCHTPAYADAVYYCSQSNATSFCAMSCDGGISYGPGVAAWTIADCGAIHGHIKVAPDGTAYVPNKDCGSPTTQGVIVTGDNGVTWTVRQVTGSTPPKNDDLVDPSVGIGSQGRVYFGYEGSDGHPWIAVSDNKGVSWRNNQDVGAGLGIKNSTFPEVVAGDNDRAAYAFLGSMTDGYYGDPIGFGGLWHLYVATTYDGGITWTTVDATPHDPVQRGSICNQGTLACDHVPDDRNLLDFNDITIDKYGRILVAYADGCITNSCIYGTVNDYTAKATISRQSGGKGLLAQYDPNPAEPSPPRAPRLKAERSAPGVVHMTWSIPDNGGAVITGYKIYRGTTSGGETFLNSTTGKGVYDDITAGPTTGYYYRITALNSAGEGPFCSEVFVAPGVGPGTDPCTVPGVRVSTDASDSPPNVPPTPAVDVQWISVAEPYGTDGSSKLVFTLQVGEAASAPPSSQWYIIWNRTTPDSNADRNYVAMKTGATGPPTFEYGQVSPPNVNRPTRLGAADGGSYDASTGTIRITISNGHVDGVVAGQTLTGMQARIFFTRADGAPITQTASNDFSPVGSYQLVGNPSCRTNNPPTANLARSPAEGCVALTVALDGSPSTDPDPGDTIASYQFSFGDGTTDVVQSSPFISHTYNSNGDYGARLHVTDSRGKISQNVDLKTIEVHPLPMAAGSGSATICSGGSTVLSGSGGVSCSWSPAAGLSDPSSCGPVASPSQTTTYTLTVLSPDGCASANTSAVTVTVVPCTVGEVSPLLWAAGTKNTLTWPATPNATSYRLYRGIAPDFPDLLTSATDSCVRFEGSGTSTGPVITESPAGESGRLYWYLVNALNNTNEGPAGNATAGTRIINSTGACP